MRNLRKPVRFKHSKVGDKVVSSKYGEGEIVAVPEGYIFPIVVNFPSCQSLRSFTLEGYETFNSLKEERLQKEQK